MLPSDSMEAWCVAGQTLRKLAFVDQILAVLD